MRRSVLFACRVTVSLSIVLLPLTGHAVLPIAVFGKEFLRNVIFGQAKDQLIGSLAGMGCKGARLASLIASVDSAKTFAGGGMPRGMPGAVPGGAKLPESGMMMPRGMVVPPGVGGAAGMPESQMRALMQGGMPNPAMMPSMSEMSPEQATQMQNAMAAMQQAMEHPLSRAETIAVFDEMASLGLMTNEMRGQVRECIELAPSESVQSVGMAGAMVKSMMLPALRDAKQTMNNLTPAEQGELADALVDGLKQSSAKDRQVFLEGFGAGFFPAPVVAKVRARIAQR